VSVRGCVDWFGMLMHPVMADQRGYPCEQDPPLMDPEGPSIMFAGPCTYKGDAGYYSSFLDLLLNAGGITAPDAVVGFP